jgi:hypothetical protein
VAWSDTGRKNKNGTTATTNPLTVALTGTAAHSTIVVGVSAWGNSSSPTVSVSDDVNGAYEVMIERTQGVTKCGLYYIKDNIGGDLTISVSRSPADDTGIYAHEFAGGGSTVAVSGTPVGNSDTSWGVGDHAGNITPSDNDVLVLSACQVNENGSITEDVGDGWTLSNEYEGANQPGGLAFKIISGAPGTISHLWTLPSGREWSAVIGALKPADVGGGGRKFILTRPA